VPEEGFFWHRFWHGLKKEKEKKGGFSPRPPFLDKEKVKERK